MWTLRECHADRFVDVRRHVEDLWPVRSTSRPRANYNGHLSKNGDSKSLRRMQKGPAGSQTPHITITTDFDNEWMSARNMVASKNNIPTLTMNEDDDEDTIK